MTAKNDLNIHQTNSNLEYLSKANDKVSKNDSKIKCFSYDLQQCLPAPYLPPVFSSILQETALNILFMFYYV